MLGVRQNIRNQTKCQESGKVSGVDKMSGTGQNVTGCLRPTSVFQPDTTVGLEGKTLFGVKL